VLHSAALEAAWQFSRVAGGDTIRIEFIGVWDTVGSVIVPREDSFLPDLQTLRFTRTNSSLRHNVQDLVAFVNDPAH
jgi:Uncharacterized alpha/beta hydrolase domain (DUF2235)